MTDATILAGADLGGDALVGGSSALFDTRLADFAKDGRLDNLLGETILLQKPAAL